MSKKTNFRRLGREAVWVAGGYVLSAIGTFVGVRLLTSAMDPSSYGILALGISFALAVKYSLGTGLHDAFSRFYGIARDEGGLWYWNVIRHLYIRLGGVALLFSAPAFFLVLADSGKNHMICFWLLTVSFSCLLGLDDAIAGVQEGARRRRLVAIHQTAFDWGRFLAAFVFLKWIAPTAGLAMLAFYLTAIAVIGSRIYWLHRTIRPGLIQKEMTGSLRRSEFLTYFWPLIFGGVFLWLQLFADRWALSFFSTLKDVGIYFAIYQISFSPMILLSKLLFSFFGPLFFEKSGDCTNKENYERVLLVNRRIARGLGSVTLIAGLAAYWLGPVICRMVIAPDYAGGFWAFPVMVLAGGFYAVSQQMLLSVYSGKKTSSIIWIRVTMSAAAVLLCGTGAAISGFAGVVWAGLILSLVCFAGVSAYIKK